MQYEIKELGIGEILDQSINLLKEHFWMLFKITLYLSIPFNVVYSLIVGLVFPQLFAQTPTKGPVSFNAIIIGLILNLVFIVILMGIINPITNAAILTAISRKYLGRSITAGEALGQAFRKLKWLILTNLYATLLIILGLILFVIPGIILMFRYWFTTHAVMIEDTYGGKALKRSSTLIKGNVNKAVVLGFLVMILNIIINSIVGRIPVPVVSIVVTTVVQHVTLIFGIVASVIFYFSCRCANENFDLALLADAMENTPEDSTPQENDE